MPHHSAGLARKCHKTLFFHPLTHNYLRCVFLVPKHVFSDFFPKVSAKPACEVTLLQGSAQKGKKKTQCHLLEDRGAPAVWTKNFYMSLKKPQTLVGKQTDPLLFLSSFSFLLVEVSVVTLSHGEKKIFQKKKITSTCRR